MEAGGRRGFTLIELLVVIAIIAILALIALVNFLEAQTRAKTTRARADMRSLQTGLEAYAVDNGDYPQCDNNGWPRWLVQVSTPVAYVANAQPIDPFENRRGPMSQWRHPYLYYGMNEVQALNTYSPGQLYVPSLGRGGQRRIAWWMLLSAGPDQERDNIFGGTLILWENLTNPRRFVHFYYDPTNGTVSGGDIFSAGGGIGGTSARGLLGGGGAK